ncbi:sodium pump decarboxylase gamma subunit [Elusimicrobium posterum]|uniref:OadG family protein n=1 Tax=Elusimicrobium posterum TaxID=3116653 RepID=UPI003C76303C
MNEPNVLQHGLMLTVVGMGFVFIFLTGMIGAMYVLKSAVAWMDKKWPQAVPSEGGSSAADHSAVAVAIAAAKKILNK